MITKGNLGNLPEWMKKLAASLTRIKIPSKIIFIIVSVLSTFWFLIRIVPKPSRATYPCMQVAAPIMSGFVIWLLSVSGAWLAFKKTKNRFIQAKYLAAFSFAVVGVLFAIIAITNHSETAKAGNVEPWYKPNMPIGEARGINPGRVVWAHNPKIVSWDGKTGDWWEDKYVSQAETDKLLADALKELTNTKDEKSAWNALFVYFNQKKLGIKTGYSPNAKIAIKINQNNTYTHANSPEINTTPQLVLSMLSSLIKKANVPQKNITLFDPSRFITDDIYNKCHSVFPDVVFMDNIGGDGRIKADYDYNAIPYSKDNGRLANGLAKSAIEATYIINMAVLKGHVGQGATLCAKNYYGITSIHADWHKNVHDNFDQDRDGKDKYMTFTDYLGHKDLGEKTMLFLVDAIYANKYVAGIPSFKFQMTPFNNAWPNSLLLSQDGVAIDAVGMDFIINEWPDAPELKYCDMYLKESAMANNPPSGTFYDPERDGTRLPSLGVMEHWNNTIDKKYSRNLKTGNGIELIYKKVE
jgi:hypothetical protein